MSCLRSEEAFSICSSSAKANSSAGVFRFNSWRFIDLCVSREKGLGARGRGVLGPASGGLPGRSPAAGKRFSGLSGKGGRKPAGGVAVPLQDGDMHIKHDYKGLGSAADVAIASKRPGYDEQHDRDHRDRRQLIHNPIEFRRMGVPSLGEVVAPIRQEDMEGGEHRD